MFSDNKEFSNQPKMYRKCQLPDGLQPENYEFKVDEMKSCLLKRGAFGWSTNDFFEFKIGSSPYFSDMKKGA